jgi:hypothetical protein
MPLLSDYACKVCLQRLSKILRLKFEVVALCDLFWIQLVQKYAKPNLGCDAAFHFIYGTELVSLME